MQTSNQDKGLHFDVSLGATAQSLIGALTSLHGDILCVQNGFTACRISVIEPVLRQNQSKNIAGTYLDFIGSSGNSLGAKPISNSSLISKKRSTQPHKRVWARRIKLDQNDTELVTKRSLRKEPETPMAQNTNDDVVGAWLRGELGTFLELKEIFLNSHLNSIPKALAVKIIDILKSDLGDITGLPMDSVQINGELAARYLCEILSFVQLMESLSPSAVSSTHIAMSTPPDLPALSDGIDPSVWLMSLSKELPVLERTWPAPYCDAVGIALLRSVVSRFGSRGESVLLRYGIGVNSKNSEPLLAVKALLCAPVDIASRPSSVASVADSAPLTEITATVGAGIDIADLIRRLKTLGMKSTYTWQAFEASTHPRLVLRGVIGHSESHLAVEALLVTGEATEVHTRFVEAQALQQRVVAVPYGREQKRQVCKVTEWLLSGRILRVEPDANDLFRLVKLTGHPQEAVRADILAAWKKLRD